MVTFHRDENWHDSAARIPVSHIAVFRMLCIRSTGAEDDRCTEKLHEQRLMVLTGKGRASTHRPSAEPIVFHRVSQKKKGSEGNDALQ